MKILKICTLLFTFAMLFWACNKEEEFPDNGLSRDINNLVSQELLDEMISLGMPIHTGNTPPMFENIYLVNPNQLIGSNRSGDQIGRTYGDLKFKFEDQNNQNLTVQLDYKQAGNEATGLASFVAGEGNSFTIFARVEAESSTGHIHYLLRAISGEIVEGGLDNVHTALFMLDDRGDPNNDLIENGDGRIFKDGNGFSPIQSFFRGASTPELEDKKLPDATSIE